MTLLRAPFQVLIFPYIIENNSIRYALFKRSDTEYWQGLAGGGEGNEIPIESAQREVFEEAGIKKGCSYIEILYLQYQ